MIDLDTIWHATRSVLRDPTACVTISYVLIVAALAGLAAVYVAGRRAAYRRERLVRNRWLADRIARGRR